MTVAVVETVMPEMWQPRSTCDLDCLPPADRLGVVGVLRIVTTAFILAGAALTIPVLALLSRRRLLVARRIVARAVLRSVGVRRVSTGRLPDKRALVVSGHVSW